MRIKILYDNEALEGFKCGWGFSALVNEHTLFDTGENAESLLANMQAFGACPEQISSIVLSHDDWDHVGGLEVLRQCGPLNVYVPDGVSDELMEEIRRLNPRVRVVQALRSMSIGGSMYVIRTLGSDKKETALMSRTPTGIVVVTGCAHPGLEHIVEKARVFGEVRAVVGGFHDFSKFEALKDVAEIVPCHCTQHREELRDRYPDRVHFVSAGSELTL